MHNCITVVYRCVGFLLRECMAVGFCFVKVRAVCLMFATVLLILKCTV